MSSTLSERSAPSTLWKIGACCSIAANALCSGGIFTFPLMSPVLAEKCRMSQPELTTIVLAGMMGQYVLTALAGKLIDKYGPSMCSMLAAVLFSLAFGSFSYQVYAVPDDLSAGSIAVYLTISFGLAGLGTLFAYFAFLFAASRLFPHHLGIASGTSMALFGLSPTLLTLIASSWFTDHATGTFQLVQFTAFLAVVTGVVHLAGVLAFSRAGLNSAVKPSAPQDPDHQPDETSQLLPHAERAEFIPELHTKTDAFIDYLKQWHLWLLIIFCICTFGAAEMVISNIGTIVAALSPVESRPALRYTSVADTTAQQVKLISIANTLTRICAGTLADYVSPIASYLPNGTIVHSRKHYISRVSFLFGAAALLSLTFYWTFAKITTQEGLWVLSLGSAIPYSANFTIMPGIVSSVWGPKNFGRNFGILMTAPFVGTPMFSYFYAFVSQSHAKGHGICKGTECLHTTFQVTTVTSLLAVIITIVLWREWKGKL